MLTTNNDNGNDDESHTCVPLMNGRKNSFPTVKGASADLFTMKVMRLPSPFLSASVTPPWSTRDDAADVYSVSDLLTVSSALGTVYLGETFRTCLSVTHCYPSALTNVSVRIEMHAGQDRILLTEEKPVFFDFAADSTRDFILSHEMGRIGDNSLVVTITYTTQEARNLTFQKFFKLEVKSPFDLNTGLHERESIIFAELNIKNLNDEPVFVESVTLDPDPMWTVEDLNTLDAHSSDTSVRQVLSAEDLVSRRTSLSMIPGTRDHLPQRVSTFGRTSPLKPNGSRSYLFRVRPRDEEYSAFCVGRFCVHWRSRMGNACRITSTVLTRSAQVNMRMKEYREFTLQVVKCNSTVYLEQPFSCQILITNVTSYPLTIHLRLDRDRITSVIPVGHSSQRLGTVSSHSTKTVTLRFLPLGLGIQRLSGFVLSCEEIPKAVYQYDNVHQVLVVLDNTEDDCADE